MAGLGPEGREAVERMKSPEGEAELDTMVARMETMARQGGGWRGFGEGWNGEEKGMNGTDTTEKEKTANPSCKSRMQ